jgi:hypothetical protein
MSIDADWATLLRGSDGFQLFLATVGGDLYSDRIGGGRRELFNPYVGLRAGYARLLADDAFALGATLGIEIWKTEAVLIGLEARAYGILGLEGGAHALFQPAATFHVAY